MTTTEELLSERHTTHGSFRQNACVAQQLKAVFRSAPGWSGLDDRQRESLDLIATKVGRILSGQGSFAEHWNDAAGYCQLAIHVDPNR
jgi:hypothetical protein